ncbi:MAG: IS1634 family transposase [Trueperaceae bacterium]|nr:MAG: IS1634 family transposase [Trueperaceae bacterium]
MATTYETKTLEHLGIVASMCDELGIGELIDQVIPQDFEQRQVSTGQAVKAMILNGLGFANRRLYLTPHFFLNKPVERLLGEGIKPEHLTDDALGKTLDELHTFGVTELFTLIGQQAVTRLGLSPKVGHLDASSFHTDGKINSNEEPNEGVVHVTRGYSRDHRGDLNQVVLELICENRARLPILMRPLSGNQSDKTSFQEVVTRHVHHLQAAGVEVLVTDSSGYTRGTLQALENTQVAWVMSVPATLSDAKKLLEGLEANDFSPLSEGYDAVRVETNYAGIKQRWLVIRSQAGKERAKSSASRQLLKQSEKERKRFEKLCRQEFSCEADAKEALSRFERSSRVLKVLQQQVLEMRHYQQPGRPAKDAKPARLSYQVQGVLVASTTLLEERIERASRFILATSDTTGEILTDFEVLAAYKDQSNVERGFRFLKDPMFLASTLYLKKAERIMALLMVMTLCLLVYAALEHRIRNTLAQNEAVVPNQKGKPTATPTARWVFEMFLDVHVLFIFQERVQVLVMNLKDELKLLLDLLGPPYSEVYS